MIFWRGRGRGRGLGRRTHSACFTFHNSGNFSALVFSGGKLYAINAFGVSSRCRTDQTHFYLAYSMGPGQSALHNLLTLTLP
jgi:hypothetical protein